MGRNERMAGVVSVVWLVAVCGASAAQPGVAPTPEERGFFESIVRLTDPEAFARAGEAYFSPSGDWIIFQAVPADEDQGDGPPRYSMYVAPLERGGDGDVTGAGEPILISEPGSANTCGWFHPSLPGVVLFGSTIEPPSEEEGAEYAREGSKYTWEFPRQMDVVTRTVPAIVEAEVADAALRERLLARPDVERSIPMWMEDGYDAEGSWSPDGRFVLYTHVDPESRDGDIYLRDLAAAESYPLVTAEGYDGGPFFSPDGRWICYRSDRKGDDLLQLFVAELDFDARGVPTGIRRELQLTDDRNVNWAPFWSPAGNGLAYATSRVSHLNYEVFWVAFGGPDPLEAGLPPVTRVTHAEGFDGLPVFNRLGTEMMWTGQRSGEGSSQLYLAELAEGFRELVAPSSWRPAPRTPLTDEPGPRDAPVREAMARVDDTARRFHQHVSVLASEWAGGRLPGTSGIGRAEDYVAYWMERAGLAPLFDASAGERTYFQSFELTPHGADEAIEARNVAGVLPGKGALADRYVVFGAHHDHLGSGEFKSMSGAGEIHEGADDNASGVAMALLLAERLAKAYEDLPPGSGARTVVFATFSAEEMGLNGSRAFVEGAPIAMDRCDLMVNVDMIGRITEGRVSVSGMGSGSGLAETVSWAADRSPLTVIQPERLTGRSDHAPFYDAEVPVLFVTIDPFHEDYHTPADEAWKINAHGASLAIDLMEEIVLAVARRSGSVEFSEIEGYDPDPPSSMGGISVRFGIMPGNYNDPEPGIVVQRVSPGGSADAAGVLAGDRLMEWEGEAIGSVTDWMEMMREHEPGDVVTVTVVRDGERVVIPVTLQAADRE